MGIKIANRCVLAEYICKPVGRKIIKIFVNTPITGNHISIFCIFYTLFCSALIAYGHIITGSILLQLITFLDVMDGSLARLKKQTSKRGLYLEAIWHECAFSFIFFALGIYSYKILNNPIYIILGGLTTIYIPVINLLFHRYNMIFNIDEEKKVVSYRGTKYTLLEDITILITAPPYVFFYILILTILGLAHYIIIPYFAFYTALTIYKFIEFVFFKTKIKEKI